MKLFYTPIIIAILLVSSYASGQVTRDKLYTPDTAEHFYLMINRYDYVVVDFFADWCHACSHMHRIFDALAQDTELTSIFFVKVNTEKHQDLAEHFEVWSLPTVILFVDGTPIHRVYGHQTKQQLKQIIKHTFSI